MNTYRVSERKDGRFDFTCENDGRIWPVGYCAPYREWWTGDNPVPASQHRIDEYKATAHKHHAHGHATPQEAAACYREWQLDHKLNLGQESISEQRKCVVCGEWTNLSASVETQIWWLCEKHHNREEIEKLFTMDADTVIWSSW